MTQITLTQPENIPNGLTRCPSPTCDKLSGAKSTHCWTCGVKLGKVLADWSTELEEVFTKNLKQ